MVKAPSSLDYIVAAKRGKVVEVASNVPGFKTGSYGNYVVLEHSGGIRTLYAHMKYGSVNVKLGQIVEEGTVLGNMGNTGYAFGAHLHFEVRINNTPVDPLPYFQDKKQIIGYGNSRPATPSTFKVRIDKASGANVRKEPKLSAPFAGSKYLKKGDVFVATEIVNVDTVSGNNKWYHSKVGNYVWSGGCTII